MGLDTLTNSRFQFGHVGEDTPMQCSPFQLREPAFHGVQPRSTGRREVKFETRVFLQPLLDGRCFVRRAVVQNYMQVKFCGRRAVDLSQERQKLFARWRWVIRPITWPVRMSKAAYRLAVLWRL